MNSYLSAAGPLAWPVVITGVVAAAAAALYALRQSRRSASVAQAATLGSLILGLLGTLLGFQYSISWTTGTGKLDPILLLKWIGESLNGLVVALAFAFLVTLLFLVGGLRKPEAGDAR